ncbi:hypothetical protein ACSV5M_18290 [Cellvibrio sp. ARAG 10.3]|uniref:hypothetical protein n=1 Tax=Cellvibrio sp. ARAG 10.3 TaxID=3451358 RepID=UPI003F46CA06
MRKNQIVFVIIFVIVIGTFYLYFSRDNFPQEKPLAVFNSPVQQENSARKPDEATASSSEHKRIHPSTASPPAERKKYQPLWKINDTGALPVFPLPERIVVYEPVSLDMELPYPLPGDTIALPLPEAESAYATVATHHISPNGDYSWRGHLDGHGDDYPVVMTYGHRSVFATITTPQGSYTLESINGSGWIYKNPAPAELSKPGAEDFMEIPHTKP